MRPRGAWRLLALAVAAAVTVLCLHQLRWGSPQSNFSDRQWLAAEFLGHHHYQQQQQQQQQRPATTSAPPTPPAQHAGACIAYPHIDSWGYAPWGQADITETAAECCDRCLKARTSTDPATPRCNIWVWCPDQQLCGEQYKACWIKWLPYVHVVVPKEASLNASVPWMSGTPGDLDLTEDMYAWRLQADRQARKSERQAAAAAVGSGGRNSSAGSSQGSSGSANLAAAAAKDDGDGGPDALAVHAIVDSGGSSQQPLVPLPDPVQLVDTSLANVKHGVKQPMLYHTVTSVQGVYTQWQTRIHWYHWRKMQTICKAKGFCEMGGYTRLLHSGEPDNIMDEIPTVVVDPMPSSMVKHDDYVVLNRPYAIVAWVRTARIPERYILMAEPDHLYLRPLPNFMRGDKPAAYTFAYMNPPGHNECPIIQRLTGITSTPQCEEVAPIGNSPTWLTWDDLVRVAPLYLNMSIAVYQDKGAREVWGWVEEMYAFAMAMWKAGLRDIDMYNHLVAQPPFDADFELRPGRPFYILHYTYPLDINETSGQAIRQKGVPGSWRFNKRDFRAPIPRNLREPTANVDHDLARMLVRYFNEATAAIPCWDVYRQSVGKNVTKTCSR